MDIRKIKYFIVLCEEMNYRKAAERLFITQPTLSQQIKQLENDLRMELFHRDYNKISLSEEGKLFLSQAYHLVKEFDSLQVRLKAYRNALSEEIKIGVTGTNLIIHPLELFAEKYPTTKFQIVERSFTTICQQILQEELAFGVCYYFDDSQSKLARQIVGQDSFCCAVPADHPLAQKEAISMANLSQYSLILPQENLTIRKSLADYERLTNVKLIPLYEMPNYVSSLNLVERGLGISILPISFLHSHPSDLHRTIPLENFTETKEIAVIHKREHAFSEQEEYFVACVAGSFQFV